MKNTLKKYSQVKFQWGQYDCYTLAWDILQEIYPDNRLPNIKNKYNTKQQALKYQAQYSWLIELKKHFEIKLIDVSHIKRELESKYTRLFISQEREFECVHIIQSHYLYSMAEKYNFLKIPLNILRVTQPQGQIIEIIKPKELD